MTFIPAPNHKQASLAVYRVVALNTKGKSQFLISKTEAAQVLTDLFQVNRATPRGWMRGDFKKHPLSRENFLRFVRAYRNKPGLESPREIRELALHLYGADYAKTLELLDPQDREVEAPGGQEPGTEEIYRLLESNNEAVELAFGAINTYHWTADDLIERLNAMPADIGDGIDRMMCLILSQFSDDLNGAFVKLGGLPRLSLYNLDCLEALWGGNGSNLTETVSFFESLGIFRLVRENEWKVTAGVLEFARRQLAEMPEDIQQEAQNWWRRLLRQPKHLEGFRAHLVSKGTILVQEQEVEQRDEGPPPLFRWLDTEWESMQAFSRYMSSHHFLLAQFLLTRRRRNVRLGWLLSFWLGLSPLLDSSPLWVSTAIGTGVLILLRLLVDVLHCHSAWGSIWDEILLRAKPPGLEAPVYTYPHGYPQRHGGAHHLLQS
jgi:hypothetical protein